MNNIFKQIEALTEEIARSKKFLNDNGFDCTTAIHLLVTQYRTALKNQLKQLRENLE